MTEEKKFQKKVEDFVCENCGSVVRGDGFTDHCPDCLWSKHVDINPGDRKANCGGLMEPVGIKKEGEKYVVYYKRLACGHRHRVKKTEKDDFEEVIKLSTEKF